MRALPLGGALPSGSGPVINLIGLSPVIAIIAGIRAHRPASPASPWLLPRRTASALFWLGDLYTYSYPHLLGARGCRSPRSDVSSYVAMYPVMMAGLLILAPTAAAARRAAAGLARRGSSSTVGLALPVVDRPHGALRPRRRTNSRRSPRPSPSPTRSEDFRADRRRRPPRARRTAAARAPFYLLMASVGLPARDGFVLRAAHAPTALYARPALARRGLDRLLPPLGRRGPAPVDGAARASPPRRAARSRSPRSASGLLDVRVARSRRRSASCTTSAPATSTTSVVRIASISLFGLVIVRDGRPGTAPAGPLARAASAAAPASARRRSSLASGRERVEIERVHRQCRRCARQPRLRGRAVPGLEGPTALRVTAASRPARRSPKGAALDLPRLLTAAADGGGVVRPGRRGADGRRARRPPLPRARRRARAPPRAAGRPARRRFRHPLQGRAGGDPPRSPPRSRSRSTARSLSEEVHRRRGEARFASLVAPTPATSSP